MNKFFHFSAPVIFMISISGCTTLNQDTGERQANRTGTGAIIGAAAGGVLGKVIGGDTKATVIGAGVGAIAGAGVGAYMDKQERDLRREMEGTGVEVQRVGDTIQLNMPSSITFDSGQSLIKPASRPILDDLSRVLSQYESTIIHIDGHTDSVGAEAYNQQLSVNRATSVRNYMIGQRVIPERIITTGYGESMPIADNSTDYGRMQNRRVDVTLTPVTK